MPSMIDPANEAARQQELDSYVILDSLEEQAYDDLTRLAAEMTQAPVALISLIDGNRQWFKSRVGIGVTETPREFAFCAHAIEKPGEVLVVDDATQDQRFATNPLVTDGPKIRFYAGAPLVTPSGHAIGTICVIDTEPRQITPAQLESLQFLAHQVMQKLEERRLAIAAGLPR
jgi:GAF domain-containing protein